MRLVQKKCPNCGAGIDFNEFSKTVKCAYCNQTYTVEKDKEMIKNEINISNHFDDAFNLVNKVRTPIAFVSIFMVIIIFAIVIIGFITTFIRINTFDNVFENTFESFTVTEENSNMLTDFEQIDEDTLNAFHKESYAELTDTLFLNGKAKIVNDWSNVGMYLLINETFEYTNLVDVFEVTYLVKEKEYHLYGAVLYDRIELSDDGIVVTDFYGMSYCPTYTLDYDKYSKVYLCGYETKEDLYNKVVRSYMGSDYKIKYTDGMYMVKTK